MLPPLLMISTINVRVKAESLWWILCKKLWLVFQLKIILFFKKAYSGSPGWPLPSQVLLCKFRASIFTGIHSNIFIVSGKWGNEQVFKKGKSQIMWENPLWTTTVRENKEELSHHTTGRTGMLYSGETQCPWSAPCSNFLSNSTFSETISSIVLN